MTTRKRQAGLESKMLKEGWLVHGVDTGWKLLQSMEGTSGGPLLNKAPVPTMRVFLMLLRINRASAH